METGSSAQGINRMMIRYAEVLLMLAAYKMDNSPTAIPEKVVLVIPNRKLPVTEVMGSLAAVASSSRAGLRRSNWYHKCK